MNSDSIKIVIYRNRDLFEKIRDILHSLGLNTRFEETSGEYCVYILDRDSSIEATCFDYAVVLDAETSIIEKYVEKSTVVLTNNPVIGENVLLINRDRSPYCTIGILLSLIGIPLETIIDRIIGDYLREIINGYVDTLHMKINVIVKRIDLRREFKQ